MTVSRCSSHSRRSVPALSRNCRCALNGACASRSSPHCRQASSQNVAPISGLHAGYFDRARRLPANPGRYLSRIAQFRLLLPDLWMVSGGHRRHQGMRCRGQSRLWRQCRVRTGAAQSRPLVLCLSARSRWPQAHNAHRAPDVGVLHFHLQVWAQLPPASAWQRRPVAAWVHRSGERCASRRCSGRRTWSRPWPGQPYFAPVSPTMSRRTTTAAFPVERRECDRFRRHEVQGIRPPLVQ
jgi:hypothetical protein